MEINKEQLHLVFAVKKIELQDQIMNVSVIIPTYNGAHRILHALKSLEKQERKAVEVVVVIDGSTDGTAGLLERSSFALPGLKIVEQPNAGRARVRNRGAAESSGDLLLFMDDDIVAPEQWVVNHLAHHAKYPGSILTGRLEDYNEESQNDFHQFKLWLHRRWTADTNNMPTQASVLQSTPYLTANNLSLSKQLFQQLGGFDERLRDAEDYDLAKRAMVLSVPLYLGNEAFAFNNDLDNSTCRAYIKRFREYTKAQQTLAELKPELYGRSTQYQTKPPKGIKGKFFQAFCADWWIRWVDDGHLKWLPKKIRYRIYDWILTANGTFFPDKVRL